MRCTCTARSVLARGVSTTCPSTPAVPRPALRCVTCRTLISVFDQLRSNTGRPAARCLSCGRSFSAGPRSEPRGHLSMHVALQWLCRDGGEVAAWMAWWQGAQTMSVFLRIWAMCFRPRGLWASRPGEVGELADLVDVHVPVSLHHSHRPVRSRVTSSLRAVAGIAGRSSRTAFFCRCSGIPPNLATSGFLPPLDAGLEAGTLPVRGVDLGLVLAGHLATRGSGAWRPGSSASTSWQPIRAGSTATRRWPACSS